MSVFNLNERWLLNLLDTIDEGIHAVDLDGVTLVYNQAAATMDGLRQSDVLGQHVLSVFPSLGQDTSTLMQVLKSGTSMVNRSQTYTNYLGLKVHTVNTTLPIVVAGKVVGAVEIAKDLTQVKQLSEQVLSLQAQVVGGAKRKNRKKPSADGAQAVYRFTHILTQDPRMLEMKERAEMAAKTSSPILVYGETGTGKELLVQAIHNASPRSSEPFLALNCAALPAALLEGILFGTVRGSFTGANDREGLFELTDGGTLFLDEIQSMPLELQAKLLRVLQEGEILRVGDTRVRRINVRVIAAMNESPEQAVRERTLRQDLYYRINVVRLDLPPLRNRQQDLPLLLSHFVDKWNARFGSRVEGITPEVMALFADYPWPGNVRELENAIEAAMNLVDHGNIPVNLLPLQIRDYGDRVRHTNQQANPELSSSLRADSRSDHVSDDAAAWSTEVRPMETDAEPNPDAMANPDLGPSPNGKPSLGGLAGSSLMPSWAREMRAFGMDEFWESIDKEDSARPAFPNITEAFERVILMHTLHSTNGNVKRAAAKLGIPRQTLQYRLKQAGLS